MGSIDIGIFIHAIVPKHVETVCLLKSINKRTKFPAGMKDRTAGRKGCTIDELNAYLDKIITDIKCELL